MEQVQEGENCSSTLIANWLFTNQPNSLYGDYPEQVQLVLVPLPLSQAASITSMSYLIIFLYAVRLEELVDSYVEKTVKFVYVHWIGDSVPFTKKGKFGVVHGSVQEHFQVRVILF